MIDVESLPPLRVVPKIICLCGSTRFGPDFATANLRETLQGNIVLTVGCDTHSDEELFRDLAPSSMARLKDRLDQLHLRKIDLADEVLVLNRGGYIGESTLREIGYATYLRKRIRYLEPPR